MTGDGILVGIEEEISCSVHESDDDVERVRGRRRRGRAEEGVEGVEGGEGEKVVEAGC